MQRKILFVLGIILLLTAAIFGYMKFRDVFNESPESNANQTQTEDPDNQPIVDPAEFDKTQYSTSEPASPWWVVNKTRPLPEGYEPDDLIVPDVRLRLSAVNEQMKYSEQALSDLEAMFTAAAKDNVTLVFGSGFRSEALQAQFYNGYVAEDGQAAADKLSARPGTSEHQTGLSFDATSLSQQCHLEECFADMAEGKWLASNGYKYGFIVRYPEGKTSITGYAYEPWHMRWVGKELSQEMRRTNILTLEEFFGLPAAPDYL